MLLISEDREVAIEQFRELIANAEKNNVAEAELADLKLQLLDAEEGRDYLVPFELKEET